MSGCKISPLLYATEQRRARHSFDTMRFSRRTCVLISDKGILEQWFRAYRFLIDFVRLFGGYLSQRAEHDSSLASEPSFSCLPIECGIIVRFQVSGCLRKV